MKASDFKPRIKHRVLLYGPAKVGKTRLAGRLAQHYKLRWLDIESGVNTLLEPGNLDPKYLDNIELSRVPDTADNPMAAETVMKILQGKKGFVCELHGKWGCVACKTGVEFDLYNQPANEILVIDSWSQFKSSVLNVQAQSHNGFYDFEFKDWNRITGFMTKAAMYIQQAPANIIIITHEEMLDQEDNKSKLVPVGGTRNFSILFPKYFDDVVYCQLKANKHEAGSSSTYSVQALTGSRSNATTEKSDADKEYTALLQIFKEVRDHKELGQLPAK